MSRLLFLDLELDAICWEFVARRIAQLSGTACPPQPIVTLLDAPPDPEEDWEEVTARAAKYMPEPGRETAVEQVERVLGKAI